MARRIAVIGLALLIGACAKPLEVSSITEIKPGPGAVGLDVYAGRRQSGEQVPAFAGEQIVDVRSYHLREDNTEVEFAGADCQISASNFTASLVTPAKVRVPIYRSATSPLAVVCNREGFRPKMETIGVVNTSRQQRYGMGNSGGLLGVVVALTADAMADPNTDDYSYQPARVVMTPLNRGQGG